MSTEPEVTEKKMMERLEQTLDSAASIVTKDYLDKLESYQIVNPSHEDTDIDIADCGKFFHLTKLVLGNEEMIRDRLTTIVNVASSIGATLSVVMKSDGKNTDYYIGIVSKKSKGKTEGDRERREADACAIRGALEGNLAGSDFIEVSDEDVRAFKKEITESRNKCFSAVSSIAGLRDGENGGVESYVQGMENLADSLRGQKYSLILIADPLNTTDISTRKQGYELIHTQLSTFAQMSVTYEKSAAVTLSKAETEGISDSLAQGISMTQSLSYTHGSSKGSSFGTSQGSNRGANVGFNIIGQAGFSRGTQTGISSGTNFNTSESRTLSHGRTDSTTRTSQTNHSTTSSNTTTDTKGKNISLSYTNRSVKSLLDKIDKNLQRLDECENYGAFDCAVYVIADTRGTAVSAAANYNALMRGENTSAQSSHISTWYRPDDTEILGKYISSMVHPRFSNSNDKNMTVTPASVISGNELAVSMAFPKKSISGLPVIEMASFGRNVYTANGIIDSVDGIHLGEIYYMGRVEKGINVSLAKKSLSSHTFITGSTGAGKSNTVYQILEETVRNGAHFLVIEPAKGEYKDIFGNKKDVDVYGTNPELTDLLHLNPFSFPKGIHVFEHMDRLVEIFNVCWPMYAAMPAVLKSAIEKSYVDCGWNLTDSTNKYGEDLYPDFSDVARDIRTIIDTSDYDAENKGAYKGSLLTRLQSLTTGINGQIFSSDEISEENLFDKNVIIDLSRVGSSETKSLMMGVLVLKLQEYRMSVRTLSKGGNENSDLEHITVLEEAHNLLKRTSTEQPTEGGNLLGKSVEMLSNAIAEMRTYGEGFIIADQAPGLLDMSVIRNTNTKIILRLPDQSDRELVGRAANLNDDQIKELAKLPCGVAAVYQNEWIQPVLCKVNKFTNESGVYHYDKKNECEQTPDVGVSVDIARMLINHDNFLKIDEVEKTLRPMMNKLNLKASTQVKIIKLLTESQKRAKMTVLAPIIGDLFPSVVKTTATACKESKDYSGWTHATDNALKELGDIDIDRKTNWGIIQLCIIYELITVENNEKAFRDWKHNGGLRW